MSYLVLARKSRPQTFAEVVGQVPVVRTLKNALVQKRVPQGLIFSGVRGTGKTTLARIMAKSLNCEADNPPEPCNECTSCREIMAGSSVDLHEIDGASNRGIQEIRDLRENIRFMPTSSRYKLIIIDEVHMLTTEAFNALLKTLEEPPDHVYFMFATTELHKVPVTILSRCQRYELKRVGHKELFDHFASLAAGEGVEIDDTALNLVVREAGGSVRDGLSLLDQIFSYCGDTVTGDEVVEVLGLVSHQVIADIVDALLAADLATALHNLEAVYTYGMDIKRFINELLTWLRSLVVCKVSQQPEQLLDLPPDEMVVLKKTADAHSHQSLFQLFHFLLEGLEKAAWSSRPRFAVEMVFIKAVQAGDVVPVTELLGRLDAALEGVALPIKTKETDQPRVTKTVEKKTVVDPRPPITRKPEPEPSPTPTPPPVVEQQEDKPEPEQSSGNKETVGKNETSVKKEAVQVDRPQKDVRRDWLKFIQYVSDRIAWMAASLQAATSTRMEKGQLIIIYDDSLDCRMMKSGDNLQQLTEFASDFFQENLAIKFHIPDESDCDTDPNSGAAVRKARKDLADDTLVRTALEVFNGQLGDIRVGPRFRIPLPEIKNSSGQPSGNS